MQRLGDASWVISASDVTKLLACPWLVARDVDQRLGKGVVVPDLVDPMMDLVAALGLEHEARQLEALRRDLSQIVEIPYRRDADPARAEDWREEISAATTTTRNAMNDGVDAIFQAVFFQESIPGAPYPTGFQGFADFLVRSGGVWEVWDTKLARSAKDTALLQLASYVDQLEQMGMPVSRETRLVLGDGTHSIHDVTDIIPVFYEQRATLLQLIGDRVDDPDPVPWGDDRYVACGTKGCPACSEQIALNDDLFLIAGLRKTQRNKLRVAGFRTLSDFAAASREEVRERVFGIGADTLGALHLQASLQVASRSTGSGRPAWEVTSPSILRLIPAPDDGDVFFDFEGDPTYQEFRSDGRMLGGLSHGDETGWFGIEYLFGLWGTNLGGQDQSFVGLWAQSFEEEERSFNEFLSMMEDRLNAYPGMHIYHYSSYERTRLGALATRYRPSTGILETILNDVLFDLYPIVMKSVAIGLPSYSLKSLEALYFDPETRSGIKGGGESVVAFYDFLQATKRGDTSTALEIKNSILDYNTLDCVSTQALRDWLLDIQTSALGDSK